MEFCAGTGGFRLPLRSDVAIYLFPATVHRSYSWLEPELDRARVLVEPPSVGEQVETVFGTNRNPVEDALDWRHRQTG